MIIQLCGLSGAGKTTLANGAAAELSLYGFAVEILDGDEYRASLCKGLGFSRQDRSENLRRMAFVAGRLSRHGIVSIICAINPYEDIRKQIRDSYPNVRTFYIDCPVSELQRRDTKGLYRKALLPSGHPEKITNLTGVNDPFEPPVQPDLYIDTSLTAIDDCVKKMVSFIKKGALPLRKHSSVVKLNTVITENDNRKKVAQ